MGHCQECLAFAMTTVLGITAVNEISSPKTSTCLWESAKLTQGDKGHEVPQVTSVPLEPVICNVEMGDTLLPRPVLHNPLWVPGWDYLCQNLRKYSRKQLSFSACSPSWRYNNTKYTSIRLVIICNSKLLAIPKCLSIGACWNTIEHARNEGKKGKFFINLHEVISRIYC